MDRKSIGHKLCIIGNEELTMDEVHITEELPAQNEYEITLDKVTKNMMGTYGNFLTKKTK